MYRIIRYIFILIWVFAGLHVQAQKPLADSLKLLLETDLPDTTRAYNMVMLAMYTEPLDMAEAHKIYKDAVDFSLSKELNYYAGLALFYEATPFNFRGEYKRQKENLFRAVYLFQNSDHSNATAQLGVAYGGLAGFYRNIEQHDSAVANYLKAIKILEELKKYRSLAINCMNLTMVYQQLNMLEKQKEYTEKSILFAKKDGNKDLIMNAFLRQAHYLTEIEDFTGAKTCADSATFYFSEGYDFSRKQNYYLLKAATFQNVNQYDSAIVYYQKCHDLAKTQNSRWNMTEPLLQIGYVYLQKKDYSQAERFVKMGLEIAEADSIKVFMKEGYGALSDIYAASGKYQLAFDFLQKYNNLKDTLQSEERKKFALDLEKKYDTEKKESQVRLQELEISKRKSIIHGLLALTFAILIIFLLVYRNFRQRTRFQTNKIKTLETEKQLMATEAVLKGEEQERTRLAKDLHDGLGGLLSGIKYSFQNMKENLILTPENAQVFERSLDMLDSSIHEMRRVAHNLMPESIFRFGLNTALTDFCYGISNSGVLDIKYQSIGLENSSLNHTLSVSVYRIIQELVNNTVKHAGAKQSLVQVSISNGILIIDVEDNGKGFEISELKNRKGMGWSNIQSRIDYLNGKLDLKSEPAKGTVVNIEIPLQ